MATQIIFLITAMVTLLAAILVVTTKHLVHAALWLILALFGVAVLYVLLDAGFFTVAQVLIYIGAIAILFIFAVMLTRKDLRDSGPQQTSNWWLAGILALLMFAGAITMLLSWEGFSTPLPALSADADTLGRLGLALVSPDAYLLPFELASVLLVAAMVGAIYISWIRKSR
jgi:NADH-quinone oxidoreductase subunit J